MVTLEEIKYVSSVNTKHLELGFPLFFFLCTSRTGHTCDYSFVDKDLGRLGIYSLEEIKT